MQPDTVPRRVPVIALIWEAGSNMGAAAGTATTNGAAKAIKTIVKVQFPVVQYGAKPMALIYNQDRTLGMFTDITGELWERTEGRDKSYWHASAVPCPEEPSNWKVTLLEEAPPQGW